jgi:glutamine synthetase
MMDAPRTLVLFPDAHGIARGKLINRGLEGTQRVGFSSGVFSKDVYGHPVLFPVLAKPFGAADIKVDVTERDARELEGFAISLLGASAIAIGAVTDPRGDPHPLDFRTHLATFLARTRELHGVRIGAELEFYLIDDDNRAHLAPDGQAYAFGGIGIRQHCFMDMLETLDNAGICWRDFSQENESDQYEIALDHSDPLEQADRIFLARMICRTVAASHGLRCTFIAVEDQDRSPSNLHLHVSARFDGTDPATCSKRVASGMLRVLDEAFLAISPTCNSRYAQNIASFRSGANDISDGGRFSALRRLEEDGAPRVELRTPTADANPYLAILMIVAGVSMASASDAFPASRPLEFVFANSIADFEESRLARAALPEETISLYASMKRHEAQKAAEFATFEAERGALLKVL